MRLDTALILPGRPPPEQRAQALDPGGTTGRERFLAIFVARAQAGARVAIMDVVQMVSQPGLDRLPRMSCD